MRKEGITFLAPPADLDISAERRARMRALASPHTGRRHLTHRHVSEEFHRHRRMLTDRHISIKLRMKKWETSVISVDRGLGTIPQDIRSPSPREPPTRPPTVTLRLYLFVDTFSDRLVCNVAGRRHHEARDAAQGRHGIMEPGRQVARGVPFSQLEFR